MLLGTRSTLFCLPAIPSEVSSHSRLELCTYSSVINQSQRASKGQHTGPYVKTSWPLCGTAKRCRTQQASNATYRSTSRRVGVVRSSAVAAEQDIEFCSTTTTEYLRQASVLRADAYYEEQPQARYTESFKRQFADQSTQLLKEKTTGTAAGAVPDCICMVAIQRKTEQVLATCDVRPPANVARQHPEGVPKHDAIACYVTNVAVDPSTRGQGIGYQLLEAAAAFAVEQWQAGAMYTTVDTNNEAAANLYSKCGFERADSKGIADQAEYENGPLALLRAELPLKCDIDD